MSENEIRILGEKVGTGVAIAKGALIRCNFVGTLEDGTKFDSSYDHGRAYECVIGSKKLIAGFSLGLIGAREGGQRKFFVPASLAYGDRQVGTVIRPHSNLIFDIEILEVRLRED